MILTIANVMYWLGRLNIPMPRDYYAWLNDVGMAYQDRRIPNLNGDYLP